MSKVPPKIDNRTYDDIVEQTEQFAQQFTAWRPLPNDQPDAGRALMRIFGRMATVVSNRLNQAPQKNFLAFLDLIGTQPLPPRPARVPLTFTLTSGSQGTLVPVGTQVASPPQAGEDKEIVFETEQDLNITPAELQAVFTHQPELDRYQDCTTEATGQSDRAFGAFQAQEPVEHSFYVAFDDRLNLDNPQKRTLTFHGPKAKELFNLPITWSTWDGTVWQPVLGIKTGLEVQVESQQQRVWVLPGTAIDGQGRTLTLTTQQTIPLHDHHNQTVLIVIFAGAQEAEVTVVSEHHSLAYPAELYIRLAYLKIDENGQIEPSLPLVETISNPPSTPSIGSLMLSDDLSSAPNLNSVTETMPRIIEGLEVISRSTANDFCINVLSGKAVDAEGRILVWNGLNYDYPTSLNSHQGETVQFLLRARETDPSTHIVTETEIYLISESEKITHIPDSSVLLGRLKVGHLNTNNSAFVEELGLTRLTWVDAGYKEGFGVNFVDITGFTNQQVQIGRGIVIDHNGQKLQTTTPYHLDVSNYSSEIVYVTIAAGDNGPEFSVVSESLFAYDPDKFVCLGQIEVEANGNPKNWLPDVTIEASTLTDSFVAPKLITINGTEAHWVKAKLHPSISLLCGQELPKINLITARVETNYSGLEPDSYYFNTILLDDSKDFYPFGEQPRFNDTFYISSRDVFSKGGATVLVIITLSEGITVIPNQLQLRWETWNGKRWQPLETRMTNGSSPYALYFHLSGSFHLILPDDMVVHTVNGETNYWVRVRLMKGNYGTAASVNQNEYIPEKFHPPSIESLTLSCLHQTGEHPPSACCSYNNFTIIDDTPAVKTLNDTWFSPFTATTKYRPALYLGFDQPFANQLTTLYLQTDPPQPGEIAKRQPVRQPATITWEYASPTGWSSLEASDTTQGLSERGLIRFISPADLEARSEFGQSCYWLRARWQEGQFPIPPRLRRLMTNTIWAVQAATITHEVLGSSNGNPDQHFTIAQAPILTGQHLEVRERDVPPPLELAALQTVEGEDTITVTYDAAGQPEDVWVRWHEVPDFYGSGPRDRHYVLDRITGDISFGNDRMGMVPPKGRNNIRMALYQTGGGEHGNRKTDTINDLKTTIPYVDSVTNLVPAVAGAASESLERLQQRGPKALRHRYRAVTAQDIEDLAFEASTQIARALAITPHFSRTTLTWLPQYRLSLDSPGFIQVTVILTQPAGDHPITVTINGPGQEQPYLRQTITCNPLQTPTAPQVTYIVSPYGFSLGPIWTVTLSTHTAQLLDGQVTITYPTGAINEADFNDLPAKPHETVLDSGQVTLMIVPNSDAQQPTPSLGLLNQVETYLQARSSLSLANLEVTEPDWVRVTVKTTIVPASLDLADVARTMAKAALTAFLHPLTGGPTQHGWSFGRHPHESDLYALLESIKEIDHVDTLEITNYSIVEDEILTDWTERQLVFSGDHQILLSH